MRILIVEDEEHLAIGLKFNFEAEGYKVEVAGDGPTALRMFNEEPFDLVVLDLMLPGMSGYEICSSLRAISQEVPILVLSARTLSEDKARAFDCGTDQYVTKPFELKELLSRVRNLRDRRAALRASRPVLDGDLYEFGNAHVNFRTFEVTVGGEARKLTQMEMQLLRLFLSNEGNVLSRNEILQKVWGLSHAPSTRTVDNFVMRLRRHFEEDAANPRHFLSVRSAGYRFVSKPETQSDEEQ